MNVTAVPLVSPVTVHVNGPLDQAQVFPPGDDVTVYLVITAPPFDDGTDQDTATEPFAAAPVTEVGAPGTVLGVTPELAPEIGPLPKELIATTLNV